MRDRAGIVATTVIGMVARAMRRSAGRPVNSSELHHNVAQYLRDEFADAERQFRADQPLID
jgi:hypothetical protein